MNRAQKLKLSTISNLLSKIVVMISGIILPRLILVQYGSEVNGLVSSIAQFLSVITFLDLGVGSVVQSALYRPLAKNDMQQISEVLKSARNYFRKIAYVLIFYVILLVIFYPKIVNAISLDYLSTAVLIIAISISTFAQYYFGLVNELLLNADQKGYIQASSEILVVVLNTIASVVFISLGFSIESVKLFSGLIILIRPLYLAFYIRKNYNIDYNIELRHDPLPQKWSGMSQHVAHTINNNSDIVVLTLLSTLQNVSIYSVYKMVVNAIYLVISSFSTSLQSYFGNFIGNEEYKSLDRSFSFIEWALHTAVTYLYGLTAVLIVPFVLLYTKGVEDLNYNVPIFAFLLVIAKMLISLRTPYQALVFSAGHFKQTQISSIIEATINILFSILFVKWLGLSGVAIGSILAMLYRTFYLVIYLSKNILERPINIFLKNLLVDVIVMVLIVTVGLYLTEFWVIDNFIDWIIVAGILGMIGLGISLVINLFFYRDHLRYLSKRLYLKGRNN